MLVNAKCIARAWDSGAAVLYYPGEVYEIDRDSLLASMKVGNEFVFQFDRNANPSDKAHDYTCKRDGCGKKFGTLAELGRHVNANHKDSDGVPEDNEPVAVREDGRKKKGRTFSCKVPGCGAVLPHLYALKVHKKTHDEGAVTQAA